MRTNAASLILPSINNQKLMTVKSVSLSVSDKKSEDKLLKYRHEIDGTLTRIGGPNFSDILVKELHGNLPGDYHKPRPLPPKLLRTMVNARAREGYMYWYMEKPPAKSKFYLICTYLVCNFLWK